MVTGHPGRRTCSRSGSLRGRGPACEDGRLIRSSLQQPGPPPPLLRCRCAPPARIHSAWLGPSRGTDVLLAYSTAGVTGFTRARTYRKPWPCRTDDRTSPGSVVARAPPARAVSVGAVTVPDRSTTQRKAPRACTPWSVPSDRADDRVTHGARARRGPSRPPKSADFPHSRASWPPHFKRKHGRVWRLDHAA